MLNFVKFELRDAPPSFDDQQLLLELCENYCFDLQETLDWLEALRIKRFWTLPEGTTEQLTPGQASYLASWRAQTGRTLVEECEELASYMASMCTSQFSPPATKNGNPFTPVTYAAFLLLSSLIECDAYGLSGYERLQALHYLDADNFDGVDISAAESAALARMATLQGRSQELSRWILEWLHHYLRKFGGEGQTEKQPHPPKADDDTSSSTEMGVKPRHEDPPNP